MTDTARHRNRLMAIDVATDWAAEGGSNDDLVEAITAALAAVRAEAPRPAGYKTLGMRLNDLLAEFGIHGNVIDIVGGPTWLTVRQYALDDNGHQFLTDGGESATETRVLDLRKPPPR